MKKYDIRVSYLNGARIRFNLTEEEIKAAGNVNKFVFKDSLTVDIKRITVKSPDRAGIDITYDQEIEKFKQSGERVEIHWKKGWKDWSGYGQKTDGRIARGYIGRSTGWIPIYLLLLTSKSSGGEGLCHTGIESIKGLEVYR